MDYHLFNDMYINYYSKKICTFQNYIFWGKIRRRKKKMQEMDEREWEREKGNQCFGFKIRKCT